MRKCKNLSLLSTCPIFFVAVNTDSDKLRELLHAKIAKRKKQIHPEHSVYCSNISLSCMAGERNKAMVRAFKMEQKV